MDNGLHTRIVLRGCMEPSELLRMDNESEGNESIFEIRYCLLMPVLSTALTHGIATCRIAAALNPCVMLVSFISGDYGPATSSRAGPTTMSG